MKTLQENGYTITPSKVTFIGQHGYIAGAAKRYGFDVVVEGQKVQVFSKGSEISSLMHSELTDAYNLFLERSKIITDLEVKSLENKSSASHSNGTVGKLVSGNTQKIDSTKTA